jgi:diguanylate cyclase (GGDEF)-like protein
MAAPLLPRGLTAWSPVGDLALLAMAGALLVLAASFVRRPHATVRGLFWSVIALFLALAAPPAGPGAALAPSTFLLAAGGVVLSLAVIEESHAMAFRDALTGVESRRALDEALRGIEGRFTLAMVDVDHFKRCNDTYGHETGDQVLRMVARSLGRVASGARVFRYGGEEFAVLFADRGLDDCLPVLERARETVERTPFTLRAADRPRKRPRKPARRSRAHAVSVTVSIGVAERRGLEGAPDDVVRAADEALYRAKHAGRNRVEAGGKRRAHA